MIISLKSSSVIFDPKALASDYLLCMSIMKSLKSVQLEYVAFYKICSAFSHVILDTFSQVFIYEVQALAVVLSILISNPARFFVLIKSKPKVQALRVLHSLGEGVSKS